MAGRKNLATLQLPSIICDMDKELKTAGEKELATIPIFSQLTEVERKRLASITKKQSFFRGTTIFKQGEQGDRLCILCKGMVKLTRWIRERREQTLAELQDGEVFEEGSLICGDKHSTTVVCTTNTVILTINKVDFDKMALENPLLGAKIIKFITRSICSQLRKTNSKIGDLVDYVTG
jgi:CRP-like cAMP-binding protein